MDGYLTINQIIERLKCYDSAKKLVIGDGEIRTIDFDSVHSHRSNYYEPAFSYTCGLEEHSVLEVIEFLKGLVGITVEGYKGGHYLIDGNSIPALSFEGVGGLHFTDVYEVDCDGELAVMIAVEEDLCF